jgi:hypothetical protein
MVFQVKVNRLGYFHGPPPKMGFFSLMVLISRSYQILCRNSDKLLGWQVLKGHEDEIPWCHSTLIRSLRIKVLGIIFVLLTKIS